MGFEDEPQQEQQFTEEPIDNDLGELDDFGEGLDSARQAEMMAATEMIEEGMFDGDSTPRTDLMDEEHTQVEQKEEVKSKPQQ